MENDEADWSGYFDVAKQSDGSWKRKWKIFNTSKNLAQGLGNNPVKFWTLRDWPQNAGRFDGSEDWFQWPRYWPQNTVRVDRSGDSDVRPSSSKWGRSGTAIMAPPTEISGAEFWRRTRTLSRSTIHLETENKTRISKMWNKDRHENWSHKTFITSRRFSGRMFVCAHEISCTRV